jgi:hypothetical protein
MPRKKREIKQVNFINPIYIRFKSVSRPETRVTAQQVDRLEMPSDDFILIDHKGFITLIPMANVMSIQLKQEINDGKEEEKENT